MTLRNTLLFLLVCSLIGLLVPLGLGLTYTDRLAARESLHLISVSDHLTPGSSESSFHRPRRAVLVVLDGLGYEEAQHLRAALRLRERGQCRITDVGSLPLSRPVYGVISTGVEQDRGGALINDSLLPHAAQSIWQIARESGMSVAAVSEVPWWRELFPNTFVSYLTPPRSENYFRLAPSADLLLIHTLYVDEAGHTSGANSTEYRTAVQRADEELLAYLDTLDLNQDLLVLTADHGHSLRGGHGGRQDRVAHVLSCFAGPGVQHREELGTMQTTSIAPALALLLGLHFPANMRAGDDDLDALWGIADQRAFPGGYLAERRQTVARFRAENQAQLTHWSPKSGGSWNAFYVAGRRRQCERAAPFAVLLVLLLWFQKRGHLRLVRSGRGDRWGFLFGLIWLFCCGAAAWLLQSGLRGSFDMSSIDNRAGFIRFTLTLGFAVGLTGVLVHLVARRRLQTLLWDMGILSLLGTVLSLAHPVCFGWRPGFPIPAPQLYFFPFFAALFLAALNVVGLLLCLVGGIALWEQLRNAPTTR